MRLHLKGTPDEIIQFAESKWPGIVGQWESVYNGMEHVKYEILDHEAIILMGTLLELQPRSIFETGTCWGYSAAVMSTAVPNATIVTCTPNPTHAKIAEGHLGQFPNVTVVQKRSQDIPKKFFDFIFIDGDHDGIEDDLLWWDYTDFMFFHDYSPKEASARPCRVVYNALKKFRPDPDILVVDDQLRGIIGWENAQRAKK